MPPEINQTNLNQEVKPKQKISNFWMIVIVLVVIIFIILIVYFSKDRGFRGYSEETIRKFNEATTAPDVSQYSEDTLEAFGEATTAPETPDSANNFNEVTTAPEF